MRGISRRARAALKAALALTLAVSAHFLAGCPGEPGGDEERESVKLSLVVPPPVELSPGEMTLAKYAGEKLRDGFESLKSKGLITGEVIVSGDLSGIESGPEDNGALLIAPGFSDAEILGLAERLSGNEGALFVIGDKLWPEGTSIKTVTFDYTSLGFLAGGLVTQMTKAGTIGVLVDEGTYRGRALLSGVEQGSKWVRGGARVESLKAKDSTPEEIARATRAFHLKGGEYLLYDATVFGDYPLYAVSGMREVLVAFGRDLNALGHGVCMTSYVWDYEWLLEKLTRKLAEPDELGDTVIELGLGDGGLYNTGFADYKRYRSVDETILETLENYEAEIISGEIELKRPSRERVTPNDGGKGRETGG